jgi:hypothetical protein
MHVERSKGVALVPFGRKDLNTGTRGQPAAGKGMSGAASGSHQCTAEPLNTAT